MLTRCYQFSVVDDTNLIGIHNGGQFVSNHHEGLAFYKFCNGCFHLFFIFGVSIGCCFIKNYNGGISNGIKMYSMVANG